MMMIRGPGMGPPPGSRANAKGATGQAAATTGQAQATTKTLWYLDDKGELAAINAQVGSSDGSYTELLGPSDLEGRQIILRVKAE